MWLILGDSYIHETGDIAGVTKERSMLYTLHVLRSTHPGCWLAVRRARDLIS